MKKSTGIAIAALLVIAAFGIVTVSAAEFSNFSSINITPANQIRFDEYGDDTYFINFTTPDGGLNAIHISDSATTVGQVTSTTSTSGEFFVTDFGGRYYQSDIVLLIGVNLTHPDDYLDINLNISGNNWTPDASGYAPPEENVIHKVTLNATFTEGDFTDDIIQTWKLGPAASIPVFNTGSDYYRFIIVDTWAGTFNNFSSSWADNGSVRVAYDIDTTNLHSGSSIVFNAYAWNDVTRNKQNVIAFDVPGIRWTNDVEGTKTNANVWKVYKP